MKLKLKDLYGRRVTPGARILFLIVIALFGLSLVFSGAEDVKTNHNVEVVDPAAGVKGGNRP